MKFGNLKYVLIPLLLFLISFSETFAQYDKDVFFFRGRSALAEGKYSNAISSFNILARIDSTDYWTFFYRGIAKYNLGDLRGARGDFNTSVRLNPVFTSGYHYKAITESRFGDYDKALADLQTAIGLRPGYIGLYYSRTTKALADYNKAISLDRFEPEGFIRRGRLYASQHKYQEAIADMNMAISLDSTSTLAYFNRAIMFYEQNDYNSAMADLNKVLEEEPGNALTLYNRRSYFVNMSRWLDAKEDYDRAIELYPDFAKAYMNRSYVENMLGMKAESKKDYDTANRKVSEYRSKTGEGLASFADTTKKYSSLLSLDADFAKKDFDDEMLQHRDVDVRLRPLYRFRLADESNNVQYALRNRFENALIDKFERESAVPVVLSNLDTVKFSAGVKIQDKIYSLPKDNAGGEFLKALSDVAGKQYNSALAHYDNALDAESRDKYATLYRAFYYMNRAVLRADMIDFISSIENNVQTLTMDDQGTTRARVRDQVSRQYDYTDAINDMQESLSIVDDIPYLYYNLANIQCLSSSYVEAIGNYSKAISLYPYMGDAYFNRGLVLIYLKDKEKGCIDLSRAGELGVGDAYGVIKKYCESEEK